MPRKQTTIQPIDPRMLSDFITQMNENVIPEIVQAVEERRLLAVESRDVQLKVIYE